MLKPEETIIIIKPEAIRRKLVGRILSRIEDANLDIVSIMHTIPDREILEKHYPDNLYWKAKVGNNTLQVFIENDFDLYKMDNIDTIALGNDIRNFGIEDLENKPVIVGLIRGEDAVERVRKIIGYTSDLHSCSNGTIRGDFGGDTMMKAYKERRAIQNLVHRSSSREEAEHEVKLWFGGVERVGH